MPNPISQVCRDANIFLANAGMPVLSERPALAVLAMDAIATWSNVENFLLNIYIALAGGNKSDAATMFLAIEGDGPRTAAITALADRNLDALRREMLRAIVRTAVTYSKDRHKLAHWVWGLSPNLPDALLLANPRVLASLDVQDRDAFTNNVFVYRQADFERITANNTRLCGLGALFRLVLQGDFDESHPLYAQLSREPEIAEVISRRAQQD